MLEIYNMLSQSVCRAKNNLPSCSWLSSHPVKSLQSNNTLMMDDSLMTHNTKDKSPPLRQTRPHFSTYSDLRLSISLVDRGSDGLSILASGYCVMGAVVLVALYFVRRKGASVMIFVTGTQVQY